MNTRHAPSPLSRGFAGVMLAASVITAAGPASAVTCTLKFPTGPFAPCTQGTSAAEVDHVLSSTSGTLLYHIILDMTGGTTGAVAYGIDVNGTHVNGCLTMAADDDPRRGRYRAVSGPQLACPSGTTVPSNRLYNHPQNMRSTFVAVI